KRENQKGSESRLAPKQKPDNVSHK
ncbi:hypothetical protein Q604_UNBC14484G0001, partial [human gut metagenome]